MKEKCQVLCIQSWKAGAIYLAAALLTCALTSVPLPAQFAVRSVNLAYLARRADIILQGQIVSVRHKSLPGYPNVPIVEVTLNVERSLRGIAGKTYTFREVYLGLRMNDGKGTYRKGQRLFLFLPAPSQYGLSSPIGIGQGRFHIAADAAGGGMLANEHGNAGLFRDVERDSIQAGKRLTTEQKKLASVLHGPVHLEEFVSLVKSLATLPRIQ